MTAANKVTVLRNFLMPLFVPWRLFRPVCHASAKPNPNSQIGATSGTACTCAYARLA